MNIKKSLDVNYDLGYLVIVPQKRIDLFDAFSYTFENTLLFNNSVEDIEFLSDYLRKNLVGQLVFVDYYAEYGEIINTLIDEHVIKFIFTGSLGKLSDTTMLDEFNQICDMYDAKMIDEIGFLDYGLYKSVHGKRRNTKFVMLDVAKEKPNLTNNNSIGLLNADDSNYDSYYNELGCIKLLSKYRAKIFKPVNKSVDDFLRNFKIEAEIVDSYEDLIGDNACNLDVNFAGARATRFIQSMDRGIPCILGNNNFVTDEYVTLNDYLVVKSDDNMNEMTEKVRAAIDNKERILKEYKRFRTNYSKKVKDLVHEFLGCDVEIKEEKDYEKLLTVVVPVYNTEKYLAGCLDSIIAAKIPEMEILVINDGSTDESEKVIENYSRRNPGLIRYINQKNRGLGNVRNVALKEAKGKYIASVDSDDTIENGFLIDALTYMKKDVDIIICDWMSVSKKERFETRAIDWVFEKRKTVEGLLYTTIMPSTCNKIMKISLFTEKKIVYLEQKYEDLSANPLVLLEAKTIKYINKPYYNYYLRDNSLMRSKINPKEMADALVYLDKRLKDENVIIDMDEFKYYTYSWRIEEYIINPLYELNGKELNEAVKYIYRNAFDIIKSIFDSKYYKKMLNGIKTDELRKFIKDRNEAFLKKKLGSFIEQNRDVKKLTAGIVYYGD